MKAAEEAVYQLVKGAPTGYNRDLQEAKEPFMEGIDNTRIPADHGGNDAADQGQ